MVFCRKRQEEFENTCSSPKTEQHLDHLLPSVESGDLEGREALAVPRGEGAVARGELFLDFKVFEGERVSFFLPFSLLPVFLFSAKVKKKKQKNSSPAS